MLKNLIRPNLANSGGILLSLSAFLFLFSGHLHLDTLSSSEVTPLSPENGGDLLVSKDGFSADAVYHMVPRVRTGRNVAHYGSWVTGDGTVGRAQSDWFRATPSFQMQVAGYPVGHNCELYIEVQTKSGGVERITYSDENPAELWRVWDVALPPNSVRFRIIATDNSTVAQGWLGFSQPFRFRHTGADFLKEMGQVLLCAVTAAAALVAILSPGFFWRRWRGLEFIWIAVPGFLLLAILGLLCWLAPPAFNLRNITHIVLGLLFLYAIYHSVRFPLSTITTQIERRILLTVLLLLSLCVAFTNYSLGARGELYAGTISRTYQVGLRSDSRIPYHVLQLIVSHARPHQMLAQRLFGEWGFAARPPLVALAASPIVLTLPLHVPDTLPEQNWTIFDPEGFAAFRIAMMAIACCSLISVFGLARAFVDEEWALLAFLVAVTAPFVIHEIYFTWPKLESAWFLLLAAFLILRARPLLAGLFWGISYLCHPLAVVVGPLLLGVAYLHASRKASKVFKIALQLLPGLSLCVAIWLLVNRHYFTQGRFLQYPRMADGLYDLGWSDWLKSRWDSLANTLLPLYLFFFNPDHPSNRSLSGAPPKVVLFCLQYWNTLPFGVGITYFFFLLKFLARAGQWLLFVLVIPFLCFTVYWGFSSGGMLREGLHPWFLALMIASVIFWRKSAAQNISLATACGIALLLRGFETLLMLLLPAIWTNHKFVSEQFLFADSFSLIAIFAASACLYGLCFHHAWHTARVTPVTNANWESGASAHLDSQSKDLVQ